VARAYRARIEGRDEPAAWDLLARTWEALERPYQVARARWRQAEAALGAGDGRAGRTAARAPLLEAVRLANELGAGPLLRELEELARRALIPLPEPAEGAVALEVEARVRVGDPVAIAVRSRRQVPDAAFEAGPDWGSGGAAAPAEDRLGLALAFVGPAEPPPGDTFGLSLREREVLVQLALGRTNREIGERLFISQKTVGVHVGNILAKLGVSGRVEAAAVAIRLGLTEQQ
jgi:DNA-binding CsgD family transcriptional regulator